VGKEAPRRGRQEGGGPLRHNKPPPRQCTSLLDLSSTGLNGNGTMRSTTPCRGDRFIPNRSATDREYAQHSLSRSSNDLSGGTNSNDASVASLANQLANQLRQQKMSKVLNEMQGARILSFRNKAPAADEAHANNLKVLYSTGKPKAALAAKTRQVAQKPEKILDAPDFVDDFYLHLLDWSSNNRLAVALMGSLFVWNAGDGTINELFAKEDPEDYICSVKWVNQGNILAASNSTGHVELWDAAAAGGKLLRVMSGHSDRVPCLDWAEHVLASGCKDGRVHLHDVRVANHHVCSFTSHSQEVCGMAWSPNQQLLATGANDNLCLLWDPRLPNEPVHVLNQHQSAIKAISWCPWQQEVLATGGGTSDRAIKFWSAGTGNLLNSVDSGSQVSSLVWNTDYRELLSSHGFSHNQITLWTYPKMAKVADLSGHTSRILKTVVSPDGSMVASAAADETIRLWKTWPVQVKKAKKDAIKEATGGFKSQRVIR